ncbi:uncharacterized protein LOC121024728 isoform X2 [Herpailurus yagouaroundi]|nr:uncharacterized protein LOC121024728 isoform X2 [Puma yagouaroundi]
MAGEGARDFTFQIPNPFLTLPKTRVGSCNLLLCTVTIFFRLVFQLKETRGSKMVFLFFFFSVRLKIKQNRLTRRVYPDNKLRLPDPSSVPFPQCIGFGPGENTPGSSGTFSKPPLRDPGSRASLEHTSWSRKEGRIGMRREEVHPKLGRNPRAGEVPHNSPVNRLLEVLFSSRFFLYLFPFLFLPSVSFLRRFTKLKRNYFSPDYLDSRRGPSGVSLPSSSRPPRPRRGAGSEMRPVPKADLFGLRHTTICDSNPAGIRQPIGQGAEALLPNAKGCLGTQWCSVSRGGRDPGEDRETTRLYPPPETLSSISCQFTKLPAAPARFRKERIQRIQFLI